jgi:hypothetical protein
MSLWVLAEIQIVMNMAAGKLLIKVATLAPILAIVGMGYEARSPHKPFEFIEYSKPQANALEAYVPLMKLADQTLPAAHRSTSDQTRRFADEWISKFRAGKLEPLFPVFHEETDEEGPRNQVFLVWDRVVSELQLLQHEEAKEGDWHGVASDSVRLMALLRAVKYSDIGTVSSANSQVRGLIGRIKKMKDNFNPSERIQIAKEIEASADPVAFHKLIERVQVNLESYSSKLEAINEASDIDPKTTEDASEQVKEEQTRSNMFCSKEERYLQAEAQAAARILRAR